MKKIISIMAAAMLLTATPEGFNAEAKTQGEAAPTNVKVVRKGDILVLAMDLVLDNLKLGTNDQITYRPVVTAGDNTAVFAPIVLNGRNQALKIERNPSWATPGAMEMRRYNGKPQTVTVRDTIAWQPWMETCNVALAEDVCGCGDLKSQRKTPLADLDYRPAPEPMVVYITPNAEAQKNRDESGQAFVDFIVNKIDIQPTYRNNTREIQKIINTINLVKDDPFVTITNINIHGYASPEGTYEHNTYLATNRAAALKNYVKSLYDLPDKVFTSNATPEDWENLRKLVAASSMPERDALLNIIDNTPDPDKRDAEMKRQYPQAYAMMLKEWYPGLRHSDYKVSYVVRPLTIEEAKQVLKTNPKNLSLNEMFLVAQTYEPGSKEFNDVFETALRIFPTDPIANLNAACVALNEGNLSRAATLLEKAGNSPEAQHARGLLALKKGDYSRARALLQEALDNGVEQAEKNLEILDRMEWLKNNS